MSCKLIFLLGLLLLPSWSLEQFYTGSDVGFGKNRVQYGGSFRWKSQNFEHFRLYYYSEGDELTEFVARTVQEELNTIGQKLGQAPEEHLEIVLFESLYDYRQSNIGNFGAQTAVGGQAQVVSGKLIFYYPGDHAAFRQQIARVLAIALLKRMLYGEKWASASATSGFNDFPAWFIDGFSAYLSRPWDGELEARIREGITSRRFDDFTQLSREEQLAAGFAFWHFLEEVYGNDQVINIVRFTAMSGNIDRSMKYLLQQTFKDLHPEFLAYYRRQFRNYYDEPENPDSALELKTRGTRELRAVTLSPDGKTLAYATKQYGRVRIYLEYPAGEMRSRKIFSVHPKLRRIPDLVYPLLAWQPQGQALAFIYETKGQLKLCIYTLSDRERTVIDLKNIEQVLSFEYAPDGKQLIFSGVSNTRTDLYRYRIAGNSVEKMTDDFWDDLDPHFSPDGKSVIFSSNRFSDTLPQKKQDYVEINPADFDLFRFPLESAGKHRVVLERITKREGNEREGRQLSEDLFLFLSDRTGSSQLYAINRDSTVSFVDTLVHYRYVYTEKRISNFGQPVLSYEPVSGNKVLLTLFAVNEPAAHLVDMPSGDFAGEVSFFTHYFNRRPAPAVPTVGKRNEDSVSYSEIVISDSSGYEKEILVLFADNHEKRADSASFGDLKPYERPRMELYRVNFTKDYAKLDFENNFLNTSYQRYPGPGSVYFNPGPNMLFTSAFSDVMEDYRVTFGVRVPVVAKASEFFTRLELHRKRLDHELLFYRRSYSDRNTTGALYKLVTQELRDEITFPVNEVLSLRATVSYRLDLNHYLTEDDASLARKTEPVHQAGMKLAAVFDNSYEHTINCVSGTRAKVFTELLQTIGTGNGSLINLGMDVRHGIRLFRNMIWVNRLAAATSLGTNRLLYYMGGLDNWFGLPGKNFDTTMPVDPNGQFAYQTLATPMRGFIRNARNGNSFVVFNSEFRIPVFTVLSKYPVRNEPLRTFQLVAFFDLGTAWTGPTPFSPENYFNTQIIYNKPVTIKLFNAREPIVGGFGGGLRTKLFGYFMRFDLGWGIENGQISQKPIPYFSFGTDI